MRDIPDDPIVACMERTGYPSWMQEDEEETEDEIEDEKKHFVIDDDKKAEWALGKIKEARDEHDRLMALVEQQQEELEAKRKAIDKRLERETSYLRQLLEWYMDRVKCKSTKTQDTYQLLSGKLVRKKPGIEYKVDSDLLSGWLKENGMADLVVVTEKPKWGEVKKKLQADEESGVVYAAETGEVVEGVTAVEKPAEFDIKFN